MIELSYFILESLNKDLVASGISTIMLLMRPISVNLLVNIL